MNILVSSDSKIRGTSLGGTEARRKFAKVADVCGRSPRTFLGVPGSSREFTEVHGRVCRAGIENLGISLGPKLYPHVSWHKLPIVPARGLYVIR